MPGLKKSSLHWSSLPAEIQSKIFNIIHEQKANLGNCAAVSKEWQASLEARNCSLLKLQASELDLLEHFPTRLRGLVRHVWLNIDLPKYTCRVCAAPESKSFMWRNHRTVRSQIQRLFHILSFWSSHDGGIELELTIQSPSDVEHHFHHYDFGNDTECENGSTNLQQQSVDALRVIHDPKHGWSYGSRDTGPPLSAFDRIFKPLRVVFPDGLSIVHVVTRFTMRRQCRRQLTYMTLCHIMKSLPCVEAVRLERWRVPCLVARRMCSTLESVTTVLDHK